MSLEEELKLEKIRRTRSDPYQKYQAYLDAIEQSPIQVGKMQGKEVKVLSSSKSNLSFLWKKFS